MEHSLQHTTRHSVCRRLGIDPKNNLETPSTVSTKKERIQTNQTKAKYMEIRRKGK